MNNYNLPKDHCYLLFSTNHWQLLLVVSIVTSNHCCYPTSSSPQLFVVFFWFYASLSCDLTMKDGGGGLNAMVEWELLWNNIIDDLENITNKNTHLLQCPLWPSRLPTLTTRLAMLQKVPETLGGCIDVGGVVPYCPIGAIKSMGFSRLAYWWSFSEDGGPR